MKSKPFCGKSQNLEFYRTEIHKYPLQFSDLSVRCMKTACQFDDVTVKSHIVITSARSINVRGRCGKYGKGKRCPIYIEVRK